MATEDGKPPIEEVDKSSLQSLAFSLIRGVSERKRGADQERGEALTKILSVLYIRKFSITIFVCFISQTTYK